jgi:HEAT repeat protein
MTRRLGYLLLMWAIPAGGAHAYIDSTPSLGKVLKDASNIVLLQVDKINLEKRIIIYKKLADLKGEHSASDMKHQITDGWNPREPRVILDWAQPGRLALCFHDGKIAVTCIGKYWYESSALEAPWWTMTSGRPELSLSYFGSVEKLRQAVPDLLAGKDAVITAISHGARSDVWQYDNVGFRKVLRGKDCPVWRIKASLEMPGNAAEAGSKDSKWFVGPGAAGAEEVPALAKKLRGGPSELRVEAAEDLGLIGQNARGALPQLIQALEDADSLVRISAARAVALIEKEHEGIVAVLEKALKIDNAQVRTSAAIALGDIAAQAKGAVPALIDVLEDRDPGVRWAAADALGRIGGDAEVAVAALAQGLRDPAIRTICADALGGVGSSSRGAVPLLRDALKDHDPSYRWSAAVALTRIDSKAAKAAMPLFIEKLKSGDPRARWDAMLYVGNMGLDAKEAAPAVLELVKNGDAVAATKLAAIAGPEATQALPLLLQVLADDWDTSENIAQVGPAAVPELLKMIEKKDAKNRPLAIKALGLIGAKSREVVPHLILLLSHSDADLRNAAASALGGIEPRPKESVPALTKILKDEDVSVRIASAWALIAVEGFLSDPVKDAMMVLLKHEDATTRRDAAAVLAESGAEGKSALPLLQEMSKKDADAGVRSTAALAIARSTGAEANQRAVKVMLEALKEKDPRVRQDGARCLGQVGSDAKSAIPALTRALEDENEDVRKSAAEALDKIQSK